MSQIRGRWHHQVLKVGVNPFNKHIHGKAYLFKGLNSSYQSGSSRIFHHVRIQLEELRLLLPNQKEWYRWVNFHSFSPIDSKVLPPNLVEIFQ